MQLATDVPERLANSHSAWLQAVNGSDLAGYAEVVAENVVWIPPGQDAVEGRANFRRWLTPFFEEYDYEFAITDFSFRMAGRWAAERGRFHSRLTPRDGGQAMEHSGRFLVLWRQDDDSEWRIDRYLDQTPIEGHAPDSPSGA